MTRPQSWRSRAGSSLAQQPMSRWGMGLGAVLLAVSGLFGGWAPAPPPEPAGVGTVVDGGAWRVTVTGGRLVGELAPMRLSKPDSHWVVVLATVEVTAEKTWTGLGRVIQLTGVPGIERAAPDGVVLMRDATKIDQLHPGMPEKLAFFWEQPAGHAPPTEVSVRVMAWEFRQNSLTLGYEWFPNDNGVTQVRTPVTDRREAQP